MSPLSRDPETDELMADQALFGSAHDQDPTFELAAAAVDLATLRHEPMPEKLRARLEQAIIPSNVVMVRGPARTALWSAWLAAAACAAMAAVGWWSFVTKRVPPVVVERVVPGLPSPLLAAPPPAATPLETQRAELLQRATDVVTIPWTPTKDAAALGVSGDVVWSQSEQRGFMRFHGLAPNDPKAAQYQLWVFDKSQEHPIDGGVFDVNERGDVTVVITAKLHVLEPQLFAVTIEKPGGVVVSKKQHIVVTAPYKAG
jgi:hypothetical protein